MRGEPRKLPELFCALIEAVTEDMHWRGDNGSVWSLNIWIDRGWSGHALEAEQGTSLLELSTSDIALYHFMGKIISKYDDHVLENVAELAMCLGQVIRWISILHSNVISNLRDS